MVVTRAGRKDDGGQVDGSGEYQAGRGGPPARGAGRAATTPAGVLSSSPARFGGTADLTVAVVSRARVGADVGAGIAEHLGTSVAVHATARELLAAGGAHELSVILLEAGPEAAPALEELRRVLPAHVPRRVLLAPGLGAELVGLAIEHRVDGVVLATYAPVDVVAALRHIAGGHAVFPDGWQELMATHVPRASAIPELSDRQRQVLDLLAAGRRNDEIADELLLSPNTVKFHVRAIFSRLGVRNRAEAAELLARIEREP